MIPTVIGEGSQRLRSMTWGFFIWGYITDFAVRGPLIRVTDFACVGQRAALEGAVFVTWWSRGGREGAHQRSAGRCGIRDVWDAVRWS